MISEVSATVAVATARWCLILSRARPCSPFAMGLNALVAKAQRPSSSSTRGVRESFEARVVDDGRRDDGDDDRDWTWDGVVVEGAHDSEFESVDEEDGFTPSIGFMSMVSSAASPALAVASGGIAGAKSDFDPLKNAGIIRLMASESERLDEEDLLEMGGDPAFLDNVEEEDGSREEMKDSDFFEWDGTVDEEVHMDF